jgi:alkylation response protein AidB-like acyl-CoA dehydrogenase
MNYNRLPEKDEAETLVAWIRNYSERRINSALIDTRRCIPPYIVLDFGNVGLLGLQVPRAFGGLELSNSATTRILQQLAAIDVNLATFVVVHNSLGIRPIVKAAQEEIRSEIVTELATGRILGAFALTEPAAGSNPNGLEGTSTVGPDGVVRLTATKMWIGNAGWAGYINVFVREFDANGRFAGISGYVVRTDSPGLSIGAEQMTMGMRGMVQNLVILKDVEVPASFRLGNSGAGMMVAYDAMRQTRLALGAIFVGGMKRCVQLMTRYAGRRQGICAARLIDNAVTRERIGTLMAQISALERLVALVSESLDQNIEVPDELFVVAKATGSEFFWQASDWALQVLGGRGYLDNNIVSQIMRDARVGRIFEGPTETLLHYLGGRLMLDDGPLATCLRDRLDAADVVSKLLAARDELKTRRLPDGDAFSGREIRDYRNFRLGDLVAKGILLAAARHGAGGMSDDRATLWAKMIFEKAIKDVAAEDTEQLVISTNELSSVMADYAHDIGDVQQSLPGEDWGLDPYLQADRGERSVSLAAEPVIHSCARRAMLSEEGL